MEQPKINARLIEVAAGKRKHPHYKRTVDLAKQYTAFATGKGISAYMKMYSRREKKSDFETRVEITNQITTSIVANLSAILEKGYRSHYRREILFGSDESADLKRVEFEALLSKYAGKMGVDRFLQERLIELNCTDPNTWIIQEWKDFDNMKEYADAYPFESDSKSTYDFYFERGELIYLTVATSAPNPKGGDPLIILTCYQRNFSSVLRQTGVDTSQADGTVLESGQTIVINGKEWAYEEYYHNLGQVVAMRAGYKRDKLTNGDTFVWPFEAADPYLFKTLKTVSELDLTAANVAMPLTIRYGDECKAPGCNGGYIHDGSTCGTCLGTGEKKSPTSVMEEIVVMPMPGRPEDMLDLSRLYTYVSPDVAILQWQENYVYTLEKKCKSAVLNSELFSKDEVAVTATGKNIDQQNANDFVFKYFRFYADFWAFTVRSIAEITGKSAGLFAQIFVSRDLKLKTVEDLMMDLKAANESGAGPATRQSIEWDIMRANMIDSPEEFAAWEIRERFNPFSGYTEEQKILWSQSPLIPIRQRILYANLGYIFDVLETEVDNFYKLRYEDQRALVYAKVDDIIQETAGTPLQIGADG